MNPPACVVCEDNRHNYLYTIHDARLWQCAGCGLITSYSHLNGGVNGLYEKSIELNDIPTESWTEEMASRRYVNLLLKHVGKAARVLLISPMERIFQSFDLKMNVVQRMKVDDFENGLPVASESLDAIVFLYQFEKCESLPNVLGRAHHLLRDGGVIFLVLPSLDSKSARFLGSHWIEWRPENRYYFDNVTVQSALLKYGFSQIEIEEDVRSYTLDHMYKRAVSFPKTWVTNLIRITYRILPSFAHRWRFRLPSSGMILTAKKSHKREVPLLSIIMPVYNEGATFNKIMQQLLSKKIEGMDKEIIIVESNSTDNSRELVEQYKGNPAVRVLLQDKARGKGNAVRAGFDISIGDILMIQDADLEYDINDYEALLEPIHSYKRAFVLGARHGGRWKMRHFNDQQRLSAYFNLGHVLFTFLINTLYGQRMKDPFTMFKVFRRDCLHNLVFECNRFDFDFELVIKLVRKGYTPLEIPVNYDSRSFAEGKKVRMFRDPITWIRALIKYRFAKITKE